MKDPHQEPMGRVAFMREPRVGRGEPPQTPICNLNIVLPEVYNFIMAVFEAYILDNFSLLFIFLKIMK